MMDAGPLEAVQTVWSLPPSLRDKSHKCKQPQPLKKRQRKIQLNETPQGVLRGDMTIRGRKAGTICFANCQAPRRAL